MALWGEGPPLPGAPDVTVVHPYHFSWGSAAVAIGALMILKACWRIADFSEMDDEVFVEEAMAKEALRRGRHWYVTEKDLLQTARRRRAWKIAGKSFLVITLLGGYLGGVLFAMEMWGGT